MSALEIRANFDELAQRVDTAGGALSVQMGELRDLVQAGRLDLGPVAQIGHNLAQAGLDSTQLSTSQGEWALVFRTTSPIGRVIAAARGDHEHSHTDLFKAISGAAQAQNAAAGQESELESLRATIDQIKALVTAV